MRHGHSNFHDAVRRNFLLKQKKITCNFYISEPMELDIWEMNWLVFTRQFRIETHQTTIVRKYSEIYFELRHAIKNIRFFKFSVDGGIVNRTKSIHHLRISHASSAFRNFLCYFVIRIQMGTVQQFSSAVRFQHSSVLSGVEKLKISTTSFWHKIGRWECERPFARPNEWKRARETERRRRK